jgi:hypothetical protein
MMDSQGLASTIETVWNISKDLVVKHGPGVLSCFVLIAWFKHVFTVKKNVGKWLFPILSLLIGIGYHVAIMVQSVIGGATVNGWIVLSVFLSGFGTGAAASLFQMLFGWRIEQWVKSKFPKKQKAPSE